MEIYIEEFIIQNMLINICLLRLVELTTKSKTSIFKLLLGSLFGSAISVFSIIWLNNIILTNIIKLICAIVMLMLAFKQSIKQFIFNFVLLFVYTYAFGGAVTSLLSNIYYTSFGFITSSKIDLSSTCLIIIALTYVFQFVCKHITFKIKSGSLIYKIKLFYGKNSLVINAFLDTGNLLNINGKPVIVIDLESYLKLTKTNLIDFCLCKTETIKTSTVTGCNNLKIFTIDKMKIKINNKQHIINKQYVAVNNETSFKSTNYQALLSPMLF